MTINKLRYLKKQNLVHERRLFKEYFRELINYYGIDVEYFRKDISFFDSPSGDANYTYGEDSTATYFLSANMVTFMEMQGDAFLLSKFGIETDGDATIYFTIEDFNEQFRDFVGTITSANFSSNIIGTIENFSGLISGDVINSDLSGVTSGSLVLSNTGLVSGLFNYGINSSLTPVNPDIKLPSYYDYGERATSGTLTGNYSGNIDASGNGTLTGNVSGNIFYYINTSTVNGPNWNVAPQVGDFFRISFEDDNQEEYEVTRVADRNLQNDGLNPLLGKFIWRCDCVRRDPSYETLLDGTGDQEEPNTVSKSTQNQWQDDVSDEIFDYADEEVDDTDGTNSDDVYGGF